MKQVLLFLCLVVYLNSQANNVSQIGNPQINPTGLLPFTGMYNVAVSDKELSGNVTKTFFAKIVNTNSGVVSAKWSFRKVGDNVLPLNYFQAGTDTSADWILQSDTSGIKAYYRVSTCGVFPVILLKFVNSNASAVTVSWENQLAIVGNGNPVNAGSGTLVVQPGEVSVVSCDFRLYPQLVVRYDAIMPEDIIQSFVFKNITVL